MIGDVDGNKRITAKDLSLLTGYFYRVHDGLALPENIQNLNIGQKTSCFYNGKEITIGDIDGNGKINTRDIMFLKNYFYCKNAEITISSEIEAFNIGELAYSV